MLSAAQVLRLCANVRRLVEGTTAALALKAFEGFKGCLVIALSENVQSMCFKTWKENMFKSEHLEIHRDTSRYLEIYT